MEKQQRNKKRGFSPETDMVFNHVFVSVLALTFPT